MKCIKRENFIYSCARPTIIVYHENCTSHTFIEQTSRVKILALGLKNYANMLSHNIRAKIFKYMS